MSSFYPKYGQDTPKLFDNKLDTFIHTDDDRSEPGIVTINLARPTFVTTVILVNRKNYKRRIENATITLVDSNNVTTVCGYVESKTGDEQEVVYVKCKNQHIKSKQVLVTKDPIRLSINIAELRICSGFEPGML